MVGAMEGSIYLFDWVSVLSLLLSKFSLSMEVHSPHGVDLLLYTKGRKRFIRWRDLGSWIKIFNGRCFVFFFPLQSMLLGDWPPTHRVGWHLVFSCEEAPNGTKARSRLRLYTCLD